MLPSQHTKNIETHIARFQAGDKKLFDRVRKYYQGKFWTDGSATEAELQKTSTNFTFAITETALSTLIAPNPQVSALPRNRQMSDRMDSAAGLVNLAFDAGRFRREQSFGVQHAVHKGRGVFKTVWNGKSDLPLVRSVDPGTVFFDLVARRQEDIRYWYEATLLSEKQVRQKIEQGVYAKEVLEYPADQYPTWMLPDSQPGSSSYNDSVKELKSWQKWWLVHEVYDVEEGMVWHLVEGMEKPAMEDGLLYVPYDILTFNDNDEDCRGLSEIGLVLDQIEEYNWLQTYLLTIQRLQVPKNVADANAVDGEDLAHLAEIPLGGTKPLRVKGNRTIADVVAQLPMPQAGALAFDLLARKREDIAYQSALADAQRGQVVGARTATELALIEGQLRNRLRSRQVCIDEVTESVANKMLFLASRYMREEKLLRLTGEKGFLPINPNTLEGVEATFKVVPYSPSESNKAVKAEILRSLLEWIAANPEVNQRRVTEAVFKLLDFGPELLNTPEEMAAQAAATQGAASPAPGAPAPLAAPPSESGLPPQVAALADANASVASGAVKPGEQPLGGGPATV